MRAHYGKLDSKVVTGSKTKDQTKDEDEFNKKIDR